MSNSTFLSLLHQYKGKKILLAVVCITQQQKELLMFFVVLPKSHQTMHTGMNSLLLWLSVLGTPCHHEFLGGANIAAQKATHEGFRDTTFQCHSLRISDVGGFNCLRTSDFYLSSCILPPHQCLIRPMRRVTLSHERREKNQLWAQLTAPLTSGTKIYLRCKVSWKINYVMKCGRRGFCIFCFCT